MSEKIKDVQDVWVAWTNTDLTEGKGASIPLYVCLLEQTARRKGKGRSVQGADCFVAKDVAIMLEGRNGWWVPGKLEYPTDADKKVQAKLEAKRAALEKAKALGLTDDELLALVE